MKSIGWIAIGGLALGIVTNTLADMVEPHDNQHFHWRGQNFSWNDPFHLDGSCYDGKPDAVGGSERRWTWAGGDSISITVPATVHYRMGDGTEVIVRGDPDAVRRVRLRGDKIQGPCADFHSLRDLDITLPGQMFREVSLGGTGHLTMEGLDQPELELNIGGTGTARIGGRVDKLETIIGGTGGLTLADLTAHKLEVTVAGTGSVDGRGSSDTIEVNIAGTGKADLADVATKEIEINIAGVGGVEAAPQDRAEVNIMGPGQVTFTTEPAHLTTNIVGPGSIVHAAPKRETHV